MKFVTVRGQTRISSSKRPFRTTSVSLSKNNLTFFFLFRSKPSTEWSSCSFETFDKFLKRGLDACLFDKPSSVSSYKVGIFRQHPVRKHIQRVFFYLSNGGLVVHVYIASSQHEEGWETCKPEMQSRVCITLQNSPNAPHF